MTNLSNEKLKLLYEQVYQKGKEKFFSNFSGNQDLSETNKIVWACANYKKTKVLDIGCGTGETAAGIAARGASKVVGIDYAVSAIKLAKKRHQMPNLDFRVCSLHEFNENADIIVSCGTLEHMNDPKTELMHMIELVENKGKIIITCPYFINIRGIVWMTLQLAIHAPMSKTDRHFISPFDIEEWLRGTGMRLESVKTFDYGMGNGMELLRDFQKRLPKVFQDIHLPSEKAFSLLSWIEKVVEYYNRSSPGGLGGANALYLISPKKNLGQCKKLKLTCLHKPPANTHIYNPKSKVKSCCVSEITTDRVNSACIIKK